MNELQIIAILTQLVKHSDIKSYEALKQIMAFLKELDIDSLFYFDNDNDYFDNDNDNEFECYFSELEIILTELNQIGYPIGYTIELLHDLLKSEYTYLNYTVFEFDELKLLFDKLDNDTLFDMVKNEITQLILDKVKYFDKLEKFFNLYAIWNKYEKDIVIKEINHLIVSNLMNEEMAIYRYVDFKIIVNECLEGAITYNEDILTILEFYIEVFL